MSLSTLRKRSFCGTGKPMLLSTEDARDIQKIFLFLLKDDNLQVSGNTADYLFANANLALTKRRLNYLLRLCKKITKSGIVLYKNKLVHWNTGITEELFFGNCNSFNGCILAAMNYIYRKTVWKDDNYQSGTGSNPEVCVEWIKTIIELQNETKLTTLVDLCCGEFRSEVAGRIAQIFDDFLGLDISSNIIRVNKQKHPEHKFRQTELTLEKVRSILDECKITTPCLITIKHALQHMNKATQRDVLEMVLHAFPIGSVLVFTTFAPSVLDEDLFDIIPGGTICNCSFTLLKESGLLAGGTLAYCAVPLSGAEYITGDGTCAVKLQITDGRKFAPLKE